MTTIVHGAAELVVGPGDDGLESVADGAFATEDGRVVAVGSTDDVRREYPVENADTTIDATGRTVLPGFVDAHTHALFAGDRSDEFEAKLRGVTYQEILADGGGILRTVDAVRAASDDTLAAHLHGVLDRMLAHGTTTVEVKSGYGLDVDAELKMLRVIDQVSRGHPVDVVPTFMGAHAVPTDRNADDYVDRDADDYVDEVVDEQLPAVADQGVAAFCDVFCEDGVFDVAQSRRVLEAGREYGLTPKVHAEEFVRLGGSQLAAEVGAASADHLLHATDDDVAAIVAADVTPVLLPGTAFSLGAEYADARAFLDAGAPVALATDFNPNCHSHSMAFAVALACNGMGMTPAEAIVGATRNAALAVDRTDGLGTLRVGAPADATGIDAPSHVHVPYQFAVNLVDDVVKAGELVHSREVAR